MKVDSDFFVVVFLIISVVLAALAAFGVSLRRFSFLAASVAFLAGAFLVQAIT